LGLVPSQFAGAHKGLPYRGFWTPSYLELYEILPPYFVQGFGSHAQNDSAERLAQNDGGGGLARDDTRVSGYKIFSQ